MKDILKTIYEYADILSQQPYHIFPDQPLVRKIDYLSNQLPMDIKDKVLATWTKKELERGCSHEDIQDLYKDIHDRAYQLYKEI